MKKQTKTQAKKAIEKLKKKVGTATAPLLEIRQRKGANGVMVGANTELLLDGVPVRGATAVTFEVSARGVAKATITLFGRFKVTGRPVTKTVKLYK